MLMWRTVFNSICVSMCFVWIPSIDSISGSLVLTSSPPEPIEGSSVSLTCSYTDATPIPKTSSWYMSGNKIGIISYIDCTGYFNLTNYTTSCASSDEYTLTITSVQKDIHNTEWYCNRGNLNTNTVNLRITVPVKSLTFNNSDSTILTLWETERKRISCTTSYSRPRSNVTWYIRDKSGITKMILVDSTISYDRDGDFISTISSIQVDFNRTYNEFKLVCEAENIQDHQAVSRSLLLNITYSTSKAVIHCVDNGVNDVVKNTQGKLKCSVDGGNPAGTIHWNCTGNKTDNYGPNNNVTQTIVWTATQTQYCTCNVTDIAGNHPTSVKTEVLYPPVIDELQDKAEFVGDSVSMECVVLRSNPPESVIRWTSNKHNISGTSLLIPNVARTDDGVYTCTANNTMVPSCQDVVHGSTSRSLHLDVLYPPKVSLPQEQTLTAKEGDRFNYNCTVEHGNPTPTRISWVRSHDTKTWNSTELSIDNISRHDDSVYTCYASNVMVNSNGIIQSGNASGDIHLIVQFKTNVTDFYIRGYEHNTIVTAMENTKLVLECHLHSNPTSDVRIYEAEALINKTKANELLYHTQAMCSGGPVSYSCHGNNSLSNTPSTRLVQLVVNCKPRRDMEINDLVAAGAINDTVTLSYTALGYPLPSFIWYRNCSSIDATDPRFIVSSTDLKTNLTITHVLESDFGEYRLTIYNDIGFINESFNLKPQGVPEEPRHFTQDNNSTTDSKISLYWTSGFNNGLEQTFTILYRKQTGNTWMNASVPNKGHTGTTQHYTITGLSSDTNYVIVMFAVNAIGPSKSNATLICRTKKSAIKELANTSKNIPAIVGGTLTGVFVVGVIVGLIFIYRRRFVKDKRSESSTDQPVTYENLKIEQIPNAPIDHQVETSNNETPKTNVDVCNTYEGLTREDNEKESEYTQLGNTSKDSNEDAKQTYENLKIQLSSCQPSYDVTSTI